MTEDKTKNEVAEEEIEDEEYLDVMTLEYDNGEIVETEVMGVFPVGDKEYIALIPDDGSDDVYIYGYEEENGGLVDIIDDNEFNEAVKEFNKIVGIDD